MGKIDTPIARMAGRRAYIDTSIFIFFLQRDERYFSVVTPIIQACSSRRIFGVTGDLVLAEVMVHPYRSGDATVIAQFRSFFGQKNFLSIAAHEARFFDETSMIAGQKRMKLIDAIHYRTAVHAGCQFFLTHDQGIPSSDSMEVIQIGDFLQLGR